MKPLLIIKTGKTVKRVPPEAGDFEHWIATGLALDTGHQALTRAVYSGEELPHPDTVSAVVITGSAAMVSERLTWSEYVAGWLRASARQRVPVLGICYGHQLLAHALGGRVDFHPQGREMGTTHISKTAAAINDPLFADLPPVFKVHVTHRQSVLQLPPGAEVLAGNDFEPHHAVRFNDNMWGVQFHPEFSADVMLHYLEEREADLLREGLDVASMRSQVESTPAANQLLANFGRMLYS